MRVLLPQHGSTLVGVNCTLKKSVAIRLIYVKLQFFDSHVKQLSPLIQQVYLLSTLLTYTFFQIPLLAKGISRVNMTTCILELSKSG